MSASLILGSAREPSLSPKMSTTTLATLPFEILTSISENICWHCQGLTADSFDIPQLRREQSKLSPEHYISKFAFDDEAEDLDLVPPIGSFTLISLSLTCRRLRDIAQPFLHHSICIHDDSDRKLPLLIRTLSERPDLARSVRELYVDDSVYVFAKSDERQVKSVLHLWQLTQPNLVRLGLDLYRPTFPKLKKHLVAGEEEAATDNIPVHGAGHLEVLTLRHSDSEFSQGREEATSDFAHHGGPQNTSAVRMLPRASLFDLDDAATLFQRAPPQSLKALTIIPIFSASGVFPASLGRHTPEDTPPLQNLIELNLQGQRMYDQTERKHGRKFQRPGPVMRESLGYLLDAVGPYLARVNIRAPYINNRDGMDVSWDRHEPFVELQKLLEMLLPWKETIREIVFYDESLPQQGDLMMWSWTQWGERELVPVDGVSVDTPGVGVLSEFRSLETLAIRDCDYFLCDRVQDRVDGPTFVAALPRTLRRLAVVGIAVILPMLQCLLMAVEDGQFPVLERIEVNVQLLVRTENLGEYDAMGRISERFKAVGVILATIPSHWKIVKNKKTKKREILKVSK